MPSTQKQVSLQETMARSQRDRRIGCSDSKLSDYQNEKSYDAANAFSSCSMAISGDAPGDLNRGGSTVRVWILGFAAEEFLVGDYRICLDVSESPDSTPLQKVSTNHQIWLLHKKNSQKTTNQHRTPKPQCRV